LSSEFFELASCLGKMLLGVWPVEDEAERASMKRIGHARPDVLGPICEAAHLGLFGPSHHACQGKQILE
jgi:hypothetical protein